MQTIKTASLEFREGSSDKEYHLSLVERDGGGTYDVLASWGRRGQTLQTGAKASGVSLTEAEKAYGKTLNEKTSKGYKPMAGTSNVPDAAQGVTLSVVLDSQQRDTGLRPQLLNPISEDEAERYVTDDAWLAQEKFDGKRMTIKKAGMEIIAANKKGMSIGYPDAMSKALSSLMSSFVIDGEAIGNRLHAFDLLDLNGTALLDVPYHERLAMLGDLLDGLGGSVTTAETAYTTSEKRKLMAKLKAGKKEGIVFKRRDAAWNSGRPSSGGNALKCKFWSSVSCFVLAKNAKRSIEVGLVGQSIGNVTIPANHVIPAIGQVVEVQYLYVVGKGGSLYQPVYIGPRDDVDMDECTFEQQKLKYKAEDE